MKKRIICFSKAFRPCIVLSALLIAGGVASLFVRGINFGLDFKPGLIVEVHVSAQSDADSLRGALGMLGGAAVKNIGAEDDGYFQIRLPDDGAQSSQDVVNAVTAALDAAYGAGNVSVEKTDFIGEGFSGSLIRSSVILVIATLALIWLYATVRFHWDFALGAVLAVIHDALIMIAFVSWTQMEFSTTTLAAVLTIVGYSINDTVVVLDRVRENMRMVNTGKFSELLDISLSETLSRSLITTFTTLLAVLSLFVFTTGSMKDFALALIVGMISGVYSTIYISSAFIAAVRRDWKPSDEARAVPRATSAV